MREISAQPPAVPPYPAKALPNSVSHNLDKLALLCPQADDEMDPDCQEMVRIHGADVLRFASAMQSAWPPGPSRLQGASALADKFWNCLRFACIHLRGDEPLSPDLHASSDMERWFLQRLNTATSHLNDHFERNRLSPACARLQHLIRHDLSGWFLESSRRHMLNPTSRQCVRYAMLHVAHLLHPLMPNITQEVFFRLSASPEKLFFQLPFPEFRSELVFPQATRRVQQLHKLVRDIRSIVNLHLLPASIRLTVILTSEDPAMRRLMRGHTEDIAQLTGIRDLKTNESPPSHAIRTASRSWSIFIPLDDFQTHASIRIILRKEKEELSLRIHRMQRKLGDRSFMDSVTPDTARRWKLWLQQDLRRRERVIRTLGLLTEAPPATTGK